MCEKQNNFWTKSIKPMQFSSGKNHIFFKKTILLASQFQLRWCKIYFVQLFIYLSSSYKYRVSNCVMKLIFDSWQWYFVIQLSFYPIKKPMYKMEEEVIQGAPLIHCFRFRLLKSIQFVSVSIKLWLEMGLGQIGKLRLLRSENPTVLAARATALLWKATLVSNRSDAPLIWASAP